VKPVTRSKPVCKILINGKYNFNLLKAVCIILLGKLTLRIAFYLLVNTIFYSDFKCVLQGNGIPLPCKISEQVLTKYLLLAINFNDKTKKCWDQLNHFRFIVRAVQILEHPGHSGNQH